MATGTRLEEVRGLEALARKAAVTAEINAAFLLAFPSNNPTAIDPDDATAIGVAPRFAREDHQHAFTSGTASALTLTSTSTEGSGSSHARADHLHSTAALPWGEVARQSLTTSNGPHTADATTDMALASVVVDSTRLYEVHFKCQFFISAAGTWNMNFHVDGTLTDRIFLLVAAASTTVWASGDLFWEPTSGTKSLDLRLDEIAGAGDVTLTGGAGNTRQFWVKDIGPR